MKTVFFKIFCRTSQIIMVMFFLVSITNLNAQVNNELNPLAMKYLSQEQITAMSQNDIIVANFYFSESYVIDKTHPDYTKWEKEYKKTFDVTAIAHRRKQSERVIYKMEQFPTLKIELLSWDEIKQATDKIINQTEISK